MILGTRPRQRLPSRWRAWLQGMMVLDVLIVSVALSAMQRELHLSPAGLEWVVSGYALALAALIPTGGALGDHFERKRIFVSGVTLFTLASVGCALSVSGAMLVGFRVIQGIGGAVWTSSLTLFLPDSRRLTPGGQDRPDRAVGRDKRPGRRGRQRARGLAAQRISLVIDLLGQCPDRCRDRGHLPSRGHGVPGAGTPLLRRPGGRAECLRPAAADLRVRRLR